jgi:aldehyde:ferredoxin oxidoreductase
MRAAQKVGKGATDLAVHTMKGNTVRGHDHRVQWLELFDTSVFNLGTLETHKGAPYQRLGLNPAFDTFDPELVSTVEATIKGAMLFEDSMVTCRFNTSCSVDLLCQAVNAATGWSLDFDEAMRVGKRAVNLARVFNLRHGIPPELDRPSPRYGSTPVDGLAAGRGIMPHWDKMLQNYYRLMGWDATGRPRPETLKSLGLEDIIK